ncbi:hypothetical protein [Micromonospora sp. DH14]|uniref:hypothetical protein n=1 Tax=Micromonospora sp. DH14 TaxID=3040120 RepID=UPI002442C956|nr:hypothetical protein [Micromonospora sp. DH14]MDG9674707.1 hypothetical protein [Micromonospora sp. DH14]
MQDLAGFDQLLRLSQRSPDGLVGIPADDPSGRDGNRESGAVAQPYGDLGSPVTGGRPDLDLDGVAKPGKRLGEPAARGDITRRAVHRRHMPPRPAPPALNPLPLVTAPASPTEQAPDHHPSGNRDRTTDQPSHVRPCHLACSFGTVEDR